MVFEDAPHDIFVIKQGRVALKDNPHAVLSKHLSLQLKAARMKAVIYREINYLD